MKFELVQEKTLPGIPSASGLAKHGKHYYVLGDDSPFLFQLDEKMDLVARFPVYPLTDTEKILKKDKPDFEALEMISISEMAGFGSGSKSPERDVFIRIFLREKLSVKQYSLTGFYRALKDMEVLKDSELNIEAAAYADDILYLFNRRRNVIFSLSYSSLLLYLEKGTPLPQIRATAYELPNINGIEAGFSGATVTDDNKILFTCSVEDTDNAYDDGEVLGSFVGLLELPGENAAGTAECVMIESGTALKVESICLERRISPSELLVTMVTDSDGAESLILKGSLQC